MATFRIQDANIVNLRDLVLQDAIALHKWSRIIDHIIVAEDDKLRLKKLIIRESEYAEAVLQSLQIWKSYGEEGGDFLRVLRDHGLHALAGDILEEEFGATGIKRSGIWFEVDEIPHNFTGRTTQLDTLHRLLTGPRTLGSITANVICITGLGGVGKSTLARKYAYDNFNFYEGNVICINGESVNSMRGSFVRLAKYLQIPVSDNQWDPEIITKVYKLLSNKTTLFIFDNVEEKSTFKQFEPKIVHPGCKIPYILVTTRRTNLSRVRRNHLELDVLRTSEAVDFIRSQVIAVDAPAAEELSVKLEGFPLALQQAVAYILDVYLEDDDQCIAKYLAEFEDSARELLNDERFSDENEYSRTSFTTWSVTLKRIRGMKDGLVVIETIHVLSYLSADHISKDFIIKHFGDNVESSLKRLRKFSMIQLPGGGRVAIHRLVQHVIRLSLVRTKEIEIAGAIVMTIEPVIGKKDFSELSREAMSHGLHLFRFQASHEELMHMKSDYISKLCFYLLEYGHYDECVKISQKGSDVYEALLGEQHPSTLQMKYRTADAYHRMLKGQEAMQILECILPIARATCGRESLLSLTIHELIGRIYVKTAQFKKALEIYDEIIPLRIAVVQGEDRDVLVSMFNKAYAMKRLGKVKEALKLFQHVYAARVKLFGRHDFMTMRTRIAIADIAEDERDFCQALEIYRELCEEYKKRMGQKHPAAMWLQAKVEEIEKELAKHLRTAIPKDTNANHKNETLYESDSSMLNEGLGMMECGSYAEALRIFQAVSVRMEKEFGANHPHTLRAKCLAGISISSMWNELHKS